MPVRHWSTVHKNFAVKCLLSCRKNVGKQVQKKEFCKVWCNSQCNFTYFNVLVLNWTRVTRVFLWPKIKFTRHVRSFVRPNKRWTSFRLRSFVFACKHHSYRRPNIKFDRNRSWLQTVSIDANNILLETGHSYTSSAHRHWLAYTVDLIELLLDCPQHNK